jgi:sec-independent protein translocase protein TatA
MNIIETNLLLGWGIGYPEMIIMAVVLLVLFGGAKLPSLMRNMGRSVNEFKAGIKEKPQEVPAVEETADATE